MILKKLTAILIFLSTTYLFNSELLAQNLSDKLGALQTEFSLSSYGQTREIVEQFIVKRAEKIENVSSSATFGYAYGLGLGYESYHLEIVVSRKLEVVESEMKKDQWNWELSFFDKDGKKLYNTKLPNKQIKASSNSDKTLHYYSIDLQGIPLAPLNHTQHVDLFYYGKLD
ncbi:hypothetical protein [Algoriphagus vanfongensis]|uniref:hypothetical protein n=1 Tax=Algoriphagus vanfongensis TaxID=426371 RepID=UPI000411195B|nr:hypothetical protein [Algoriphagus vanfongensis]